MSTPPSAMNAAAAPSSASPERAEPVIPLPEHIKLAQRKAVPDWEREEFEQGQPLTWYPFRPVPMERVRLVHANPKEVTPARAAAPAWSGDEAMQPGLARMAFRNAALAATVLSPARMSDAVPTAPTAAPTAPNAASTAPIGAPTATNAVSTAPIVDAAAGTIPAPVGIEGVRSDVRGVQESDATAPPTVPEGRFGTGIPAPEGRAGAWPDAGAARHAGAPGLSPAMTRFMRMAESGQSTDTRTHMVVPFASFGPGHQVTAIWGAGAQPRIQLRSSSEQSHRAVLAALDEGSLPVGTQLPVQASHDDSQEQQGDRRAWPLPQEEDA